MGRNARELDDWLDRHHAARGASDALDDVVTYSVIPSTLRNYVIPNHVLDDTRIFLCERGEKGLEGVVLWVGELVDETTAAVLGAHVPEQIGRSNEFGVSVEVTQEGLSRLISQLPEGMFVLIRVHSHPTDAYHSELDDENMLISHANAISIVVPFFAQSPIDIERCSVNELHHDAGWVELSLAEVRQRFQVMA